MESVTIDLRVNTREGFGIDLFVSHCQPLCLELFPLVIALEEVNDCHSVKNLIIKIALVLNEFMSARLELSLINVFSNNDIL